MKPLSFLSRIVVCSLWLSAASAWAQPATPFQWNPQVYYGIADADKHAVFMDEFNTRDEEWNFTSPHLIMRVDAAAGELYCEAMRDRTVLKQRAIALRSSADYEIELKLRCASSEINNVLGLMFGRNAATKSDFDFYFRSDGTYCIERVEDNVVKKYFNWKPVDNLNKVSYNTLTVRKVEGMWYFFINRVLVHSMVAEPLFGNGIGFVIGGQMRAEIDYLSVKTIELRDEVGPTLSLIKPIFDRSNVISTSEQEIAVEGRVEDVSGVTHLTLNGQEISADEKGNFAVTLRLPEGTHQVTLTARDGRGNTSTRALVIERRPQIVIDLPNKGKNYLMIIGIDGYEHWNPLRNPVKDCNDLVTLLTKEYRFERENIFALYNSEANLDNIIETFEYLQRLLTENDNLLVYYAGHGWYDKQSELGYWIPVSARQDKIVDYLRNSTVRDYVKAIKSKNTLLLVDACYAGSMFEESRGALDESQRSRWAFTSGNLQKVGDGEPGQNSPFARYLMQNLHANPKPQMRADELITKVKAQVQAISNQQPKGSPIVGDEGGVFIFERRAK